MKVVKLKLIRFVACFIVMFLMRFLISKDTIIFSLFFAIVFCIGLYILLKIYNVVIRKTKTKGND